MKPTGKAIGEFEITCKFSTVQRARDNINITIYLHENKQNQFALENSVNVFIAGNQCGPKWNYDYIGV
jgi:hypothetical protein